MKARLNLSLSMAILVCAAPAWARDYWDGNNKFRSSINSDGAVLTSRGITLYLGNSCDAFSPQFGKGSWSWANGGFIAEFPNARFAFGRQELEINNDGGCSE